MVISVSKCIICGKEQENVICEECFNVCDIEGVLVDLLSYIVGSKVNPLWEDLFVYQPVNRVIQDLCELVDDDRRSYYQIISFCGIYNTVHKDKINKVFELAKLCVRNDALTDIEKNRIRGIVLQSYCSMYNFEMADKCASVLRNEKMKPAQAYLALGDFYTKTRRYELGIKSLEEGLLCEMPVELKSRFSALRKENRERATGIRKEYMPLKEEHKALYNEFLKLHNITSHVEPRPKDVYRSIKQSKEKYLLDFVAFDVETTGLSPIKDGLTEIGAIKVKNGVLDKSLVFSELIHPEHRISAYIEQLTGISNEMVEDARSDVEVLNDFLAFSEGLPLVGFNSDHFDMRFLMETARKTNVPIDNKSVDVMKLAAKEIYHGKYPSLKRITEDMGVVNNQAHRALSDAIATAEVYLNMVNKKKGN